MEETLKVLVQLAAAMAILFALLCVVVQLLRRVTCARDARVADELIAKNKASWRTDKHGKPTDQADLRLIDRAGECRWQETLRAQRRTRKPSDAAHVVEFRERTR